jgi:hypothetical protein
LQPNKVEVLGLLRGLFIASGSWMVGEVSSLAMVMVVEGWHHLPSAMVEATCNEGIDVMVREGEIITHAFVGTVEVAIVKDDV